MKSGILNLLEPSGPVQACNGIALTLPIRIVEDVYERAKMLRGSFIAFIVVTVRCVGLLTFSCLNRDRPLTLKQPPLHWRQDGRSARLTSRPYLPYRTFFFTNRVKNVEIASKIVFTPSRKNAFHCTDFHKS